MMKPKTYKAIYGNIAILKGYCKNCRETVFIIDGRYSCCDEPVEEIPEKTIKKRITEGEPVRKHLPLKERKKLLEEQDNKCIYCGKTFGSYVWNSKKSKYIKVTINYDHFVSWNFSRNSNHHNFVAACSICNHIKSDKYFPDIHSAKEYIDEQRTKKGYL